MKTWELDEAYTFDTGTGGADIKDAAGKVVWKTDGTDLRPIAVSGRLRLTGTDQPGGGDTWTEV